VKYETEKKESQIELLGKEAALQALQLQNDRLQIDRQRFALAQSQLLLTEADLQIAKSSLQLANQEERILLQQIDSAQRVRTLQETKRKTELQALQLRNRELEVRQRNAVILGLAVILVLGGLLAWSVQRRSRLAAAALDASWKEKKPELDSLFSPLVAPLERLRRFCQRGYEQQVELKCHCGCVLGCPLFTLGAEVCNQEEALHKKIKEILVQYHTYIESAIRDAHAQGLIDAPDPAAKARMLFAYSEGLLTQARILNDAEVLREMADGVMGILGVKKDQRQAA
jgi:TetR/AcrR family transcriptional repressor of nem operon